MQSMKASLLQLRGCARSLPLMRGAAFILLTQLVVVWLLLRFDCPKAPLAAVIGIILWAAVEELLFRVLVIRAMISRVGPWIALIISSAIFALAHAELDVLVQTFLMGLLLGLLYLLVKGIIAPVLVHASTNDILNLRGCAEPSMLLLEEWGRLLPGIYVALKIVLLVVCLAWMRSALRRCRGEYHEYEG